MSLPSQIEALRPEVDAVCRRLGVRQLYLFGSATGDAFDADQSDLDFLVLFKSTGPGYSDRYFELQETLQKLFRRSIDLVTIDSLSNPYFRASVEKTRTLVFAA